jgi:superkiller protein 3
MGEAASYIGRAVDASPQYMAIYRTAELVYAQSQDVQITGSPKAVGLLSNYMVGFRSFFKDYDRASAAFRRMIEIEPRCAAAHMKLGILNILNGKNRTGLKSLAKAEKLAPGDAEAYYAMGSAYYNLGEADSRAEKSPHFRKSAEYFRKAVRVSPIYADAYWGLGSALYRMGKYTEARRMLNQSTKLNPFFAEGYNTLGSVAAREASLATDGTKKADLLKEAAIAYGQALRANPNSETAHYNLGVVLHQQHEWKKAEAKYKDALRLNPKFALARYRLARLYVDRNGWFDRGRAEEQFEKLLEIEPNNCAYLFDVGAFHFNSRKYAKAKEAWRRTLERCPGHKSAQDGLAHLVERGY